MRIVGTRFSQSVPVGYLVNEVSRLFKRRFEDEARVFGVTLPQWRALAEVARHESVTQVNLANAIEADPMTVSGMLDRLEKRDLVNRFADPTDSRAKRVRITPSGEELVDAARKVALAIYAQALTGIDKQEQQALTAMLDRIRDNLAADATKEEELQT